MNINKTDLDGVLLIEPITLYEDFRGEYVELYNKDIYNKNGINVDFVQDDISTSTQGVLRGIHGDSRTWKLVSCLQGKFYLVIVNNDPSSLQYRKWISLTLSDTRRLQVLIPPKFGNGHVVMSSNCIFHYKQTTDYDRASQFTILWNDPAFGIWWPISNPILSKRDQGIE